MTNEHRLQTGNAGIKQMISQNELWSMKWIPGTEQLADCLKKKGANSKFETSTWKWTIAFFNIIYIFNISKLWSFAYVVLIFRQNKMT